LNQEEEDVMHHLSDDKSIREISSILNVDTRTVDRLVASSKLVMEMKTLQGAIAKFQQSMYNIVIVRHTSADLERMIQTKHPSRAIRMTQGQTAYNRADRFASGETIAEIYGEDDYELDYK
jgi:DNA-binding CsgD family transcriptional regulator